MNIIVILYWNYFCQITDINVDIIIRSGRCNSNRRKGGTEPSVERDGG